jgi:hypothetical protein
MIEKKDKPCKICGGKRIYGMTICYKCFREKERKKREEKIAKLKERKKKRKEKDHNSYRYLRKIAWDIFSKFIRIKGSDENGMTECYTCGEKLHWKKLQAGHFHHSKLDFDERNIHKQCVRCNKWLSGNLAIYATKLALELGVTGMKKLLLDANTTIYSIQDLREIIKIYQQK